MGAEADEERVIDDGGDAAADQWADPVDPVVRPCPADHGGAERDGGVHRRTVEGAASQDVCTHYETNGNGSNHRQVTLLWIHSSGVDGVDEAEGHHNLKDQSVPHAHA